MHSRRLLNAFLLILILFTALAGLPRTAQAQSDQTSVVRMRLEGPVNPIWQETIKRAISLAQNNGSSAIILELNTPGGSISVMNSLVQQIRNSPVPIIVYVSPAGAMAASAGTLITLAGHAAGMAPQTIIGAASPVGSQGEDIGETMATKEKEALKASVRGLAAGRGEAAVTLAEEMIDDARAVSAAEALEVGLVDVVAADVDDLLDQLDGFQLQLSGGAVTVSLAGARVIDSPPTFLEQFLQTLTDPNLVFLLLSVGVQAILIELSSPGGWVAGFIGVVCVALAVFGLGILPVNWFGLIFLVIAFVLFILDIKTPTHGALTVAGVASFIVGALVLFNSTAAPGFPRVSVPLVVGTGAFIGISFAAILTFAIRAQFAPVRMGQSALVGQVGTARSELNPEGNVQLGAELWSARVEGETVPKGSRVEVVQVEGVQLVVKKVTSNE